MCKICELTALYLFKNDHMHCRYIDLRMGKEQNLNDLLAKTIDLRSGDPEGKRKEIRDYFLKTWAIDELVYRAG